MKAQPTKSPFKDDVTKYLETQVAIEFANYMEQNKDMSFNELLDNFYSNVIDNYNNNTQKVVGFNIEELSDSAYKIDIWYW